MRKPADGDGHRTDAVVKHLAEHHPHDRAPRYREEGDVEICGDKRDDTRGTGEAAVGTRVHEAYRECAECDGHAHATDEQERLASNLVDKHDGGDGHDEVDGARDDAREKGVALAESHALPEHGAVVEDDVDAHQLLQDGKAKARPENRGDTLLAANHFEQVAELGRFLVAEGLVNSFDFPVNAFGIDLGEDALGIVNEPLVDKITRRFREPPGRNAVERRRNGLDPEHDLPSLEIADNRVVRRTRNAHDDVVREERHEDAYHDGELLHGSETPAQVCGSRFGNVYRGDDARNTDAHAADDAPHDKVRNAERNARTDGTDEEQERGCEHAAHAPESIGEAARKERACRGTDQGKRNRPGEFIVRRVEVSLQCPVRSVDDGGVETEEEPADSRG